MSFRWPNKDPDEKLDFSIDWSRYLGDATITVPRWFIDDENGVKSSQLSADDEVNGLIARAFPVSADNKTATIVLEGGNNNTEYKIYCQIEFADTDSEGNTVELTAERVIKLRVKER